MKKIISTLLFGLILLNSPLIAQEDAFKKFGIPDKFRNYREKGTSMGDFLLKRKKGDLNIVVKRWDLDGDGVMDVGEVWEDLRLFKYFFNLNGNLKIEDDEIFYDSSEDGIFNGNEIRKSNPLLDYEKKLPYGLSYLV